jgi:transposase
VDRSGCSGLTFRHHLEGRLPYRRRRTYSTEFKLQLVRQYLAGEASLKGLASRQDLNLSVLVYWLKKYERGELSEEDPLEDQVHEYEAQIAALERKVGQLTMELDAPKKGLRATPLMPSEPLSLISGPTASPFATARGADDLAVFPNLVQELKVTGPNQLWYADLAYIGLRIRFVFLAILLDAWSRKVVGYALSPNLDARLPA